MLPYALSDLAVLKWSGFVDAHPVTRLPPRRRGVCGLRTNLSMLSVGALPVSYESEDESISFSSGAANSAAANSAAARTEANTTRA